MKESDINRKIQKYLESQGAYVVKTIATNRAGVPDILACFHGVFIGIEGKTPTGVVSQLQEMHIKKINDAGGVAFIARSVEDAKKAIEVAPNLRYPRGSFF